MAGFVRSILARLIKPIAAAVANVME